MNLYIETENGVTKNHPAFEDNLMQAFGEIPEHWEPFTRVQRPELGVYDVLESDEPTYSKVDGTWADVWMVRPMTAEEKTAKQQIAKDAWAALPNRDNFAAWIFDEATLRYLPPIPRPEGDVAWDGTTNTWKERAEYPNDGKPYKWDIPSWSWVEVPPPNTA
jgi:hypothetical protein